MEEFLYFNGVNGDTGQYLIPPIEAHSFYLTVLQKQINSDELKYFADIYHQNSQEPLGLDDRHNPKFLNRAGWGIIFPEEYDQAIVEALRPLIEWRKDQAGKYYREYLGTQGYQNGDTHSSWLLRYPREMGVGRAEPENVPYYLLIVGSPEQIPFDFQIQLDVQYAVGRISFESVEEYGNYARSVVHAEKQQHILSKRAAFFGVSNPNDLATQFGLDKFLSPLAKSFISEYRYKRWEVEKLFKEDATKQNLSNLINGLKPPALLFTSSHGIGYSKDNSERQMRYQGALICQDWPGQQAEGGKPLSNEYFFSADDVTEDACFFGTIAFLFDCYGAGTPKYDEFLERPNPNGPLLADRPFIARLPQRLLSHPNGGALAVIGHVDRAWGYSFHWERAINQISQFEGLIRRLLKGYPIGYAFELFNERYTQFSSELSSLLQRTKYSQATYLQEMELVRLWIANNDAKNYILLGDPAVRLQINQK